MIVYFFVELLMEEFRIAHQKMFGGLKKTGLRSALVEENKEDKETKIKETCVAPSTVTSQQSQLQSPTLQQSSKTSLSHAPFTKTRNVLLNESSQQHQHSTIKVDDGKARAHQPKPSMKTFPAPPPPPPPVNNKNNKNSITSNQEQKTTESERTTVTSLSSNNRITIKVLSPKLAANP